MATLDEKIEESRNRSLGVQSNVRDLGDDPLRSVQDKIVSNLGSLIEVPDEKSIMEKFEERRRFAGTGAEAEKERIESRFGERIEEEEEKGAERLTAARELQRGAGPASARALIIKEEEITRKRVKELERQRDEFLALNKSEEASRLDSLIVSEQEALSTTRQNFLSNLLAIGQFETPTQRSERELAQTKQLNLENLKAQFANVPGIGNVKSYEEAIGLVGPEIAKDKQLQEDLLRAQIREANAAATAKEESSGGRELPANQVVMLSDAKFLPGVLDELEDTINENTSLFKPGGGIGAQFSESRAIIDAELRRASQLVGRFMEGGVLRKEDEEKYRRMLPQLGDRNEVVALAKLQGVREMLGLKYSGYLQDFSASGFDVTGFPEVTFGESPENSPEEDRSLPGEEGKTSGVGEDLLGDNLFRNAFNTLKR